MKLATLLFESYSVEDVKINIIEDTSLGEDKKEIWVRGIHPNLGNVGHVKIIQLYAGTEVKQDTPKIRRTDFYDALLDPKYNFQPSDLVDEKYFDDFDNLRRKISKDPNQITLWGIENSWTDRRFRGEGLGQALYLHGLKYVAENYKGIVVANKAWDGEPATSDLAMNVWNVLAKKVTHIGIAFWGGNIQDSDLTLRSRRKHGWQDYKKIKPRNKRIADFED